MNTLERFDKIANQIAKEFSEYMWWNDYDEDYGQWIWDPGWVMDFGEWNAFYKLTDMYEVLKYKYLPKAVEAHNEYSVKYRGKKNEYYINLKHFSMLWNGQEVEEFAKVYHETLDKNRAYWKSKEWKAETKRIIKEATEKFLKDNNL